LIDKRGQRGKLRGKSRMKKDSLGAGAKKNIIKTEATWKKRGTSKKGLQSRQNFVSDERRGRRGGGGRGDPEYPPKEKVEKLD